MVCHSVRPMLQDTSVLGAHLQREPALMGALCSSLSGHCSRPALKVLQRDPGHGLHGELVVVQTRDVSKTLAPGFQEGLPRLLRDLFQCLQAIHGKTWTDDIHRLHP